MDKKLVRRLAAREAVLKIYNSYASKIRNISQTMVISLMMKAYERGRLNGRKSLLAENRRNAKVLANYD